MEGARYTGFAHGVAGITTFLALAAAHLKHQGAERAWRAGATWLLAGADDDGTMLSWPTREGASERWNWWCHGGPGIALALLACYERSGDECFARAARRSLLAHPFEVRFPNLSQCHGLSGLGEIYLEGARILGDASFRRRALRIGEMLLALAGRGHDGGLTWLVEDPSRPTGDLMVGCGGVVHFLLRLALRERAPSFPLLP